MKPVCLHVQGIANYEDISDDTEYDSRDPWGFFLPKDRKQDIKKQQEREIPKWGIYVASDVSRRKIYKK